MESLYARDIYGKTLVELGRKDPRVIVLDADLSGSTRTSFFAKEFPERFFNFGVAEQNMIATAAGFASCGKIVFASTFAMFATARALDQVRNTVCFNNFNVKIVATHGGITVGEDGSSHQALEDINFLRAIPRIKIIVPCDAEEAKAAVVSAYENEGPFYIRLGRSKTSTVEKKKDFVLGKGYPIEEGKDLAILACGIMVGESLLAREILLKQGFAPAVINLPTLKPIDQELITVTAKKYGKILVCEEHQSTGGLYSAVAEVLGGVRSAKVWPIGVKGLFGQSGSPKELLEFYGLSANFIAKKAEELLRQKD